MRRYETIVILDPDLSEEDRNPLFDRIKEIISQQDGVLIQEDLWGTKKLAYDIKKKPRGYYARFDYCGMGPLVAELERFFRIDDRLMKYLTVQMDPEADVEKIQMELAASKTSDAAESSEPTEGLQQADIQTDSTDAKEQADDTATANEKLGEE
jgi:small subunit ribosomal protein S6